MPNSLRKFVSPKFTRTLDPALLARLFERHRHQLGTFDLNMLHGDAGAARTALEAFFAGPRDLCPEGLVADLHRIAELGTSQGLRLLLAQAARLGIVVAPEPHADDCDPRLDPKYVALRVFLEHPKVFEAASDMLALTARSSLTEFAGLHEGLEADMNAEARAAFEAAAAKMFEADHCGNYCRVGWYDDADTVNLVLTHGSIVKTTPVLQDREERVISYRAAQTAVLSYSAASGRLKVGGGTRLRRSALSELFADKMLGRSGFFAGPNAQNLYTLAPIERTGCGFAFQHGFDPTIRKVRIVEAQADRVSVDRISGTERRAATFMARDDRGGALDQLAEAMQSSEFGPDRRLRHIVVRVNIDRGSERPGQVTAKITPPARASFNRHRFEDRILTLLHRNGLIHDRDVDIAAVAAE